MNPLAVLVIIALAIVVFWIVAHVSVLLAVVAALIVLAALWPAGAFRGRPPR